MTISRPTLSLIAERYLDTSLESGEITELEGELAVRGITGGRRWLLELLTAGGLWWNVFWWESFDFSGRDVLFGWVGNILVAGCVSAAVANSVGLAWAVVAAALLLILAISVGFRIRTGSSRRGPEA
jgi:hypothetical protein